MNNYHVSDDGVARVCTAAEGKCPVGGVHGQFQSQDDANKFAEEVNSKRANFNGGKLSKTKYRKASEEELSDFKHTFSDEAAEDRDALLNHLLEKFSDAPDAKKFVKMSEGTFYSYAAFEEDSNGVRITLTAGEQAGYRRMSDFSRDAEKASSGMSKILSAYFDKPVKFSFETDDIID